MFNNIIGKFTNDNNSKLSKIEPIFKKVNKLEEQYEKLSDEDILKQTQKWQEQLKNENLSEDDVAKQLDDILPDAYALVREAAKRSVNQRHRDVQILSAVVLHQGKVSEQKTGEGKTLTATMPLYLNSLSGLGAHLVTPNDYLSKHGAGWYGSLYKQLGITVGVIVSQQAFIYDEEYNSDTTDEYSRHLKPCSRLEAYECDITYGTNSEFGFDYLRDNMATNVAGLVQSNPTKTYGAHNFAIVDEVDNILIDIARTPLIISSQAQLDSNKYYKFAELTRGLNSGTDYEINEKDRAVTLSEIGINKIERSLGVENLYENDFETVHQVENALKAKELYVKDKDYVVQNAKIVIVDQNTGRLLQTNRWGNGLHQAVEAKEDVPIQAESKTVATISYQNYYRLYDKLAGMTGTAETESEELFKMYSLDVVVIPTNKEIARIDNADVVYKTDRVKFQEVAKDIAERHKAGQPVLVGTTSVDKSQLLSTFLKRQKIPHEILNAKQHEKEAQVIAQAGKKGAVTVATNMAGRGVDIILGGDPFDQEKYEEIISSGGLYVIGTERHDSRRIDNQLRGRSGRQGDVGESRFYLSLQDDLLRIFGGEKIETLMGRLGVQENMPIEAKLISRSIENAQKKVEGINFDQRRSVVQFDDVMNVQREAIYGMRRKILFAKRDDEEFIDWLKEEVKKYSDSDLDKLMEQKEHEYGKDVWGEAVKQISLRTIDVLWMDHIDVMDDLRSGVGLRGYGQVDPLVEYKREGRELFERLLSEIYNTIADRLSKIEVNVVERQSQQNPAADGSLEYAQGEFESGVETEANQPQIAEAGETTLDQSQMQYQGAGQEEKKAPIKNDKKIGRNDPCWCGSGKKFKKCHGKNA